MLVIQDKVGLKYFWLENTQGFYMKLPAARPRGIKKPPTFPPPSMGGGKVGGGDGFGKPILR